MISVSKFVESRQTLNTERLSDDIPVKKMRRNNS